MSTSNDLSAQTNGMQDNCKAVRKYTFSIKKIL